ncbi:hypothetical protein IQ273_28455, partial [Nodosilinea sp. LEGE 07298]
MARQTAGIQRLTVLGLTALGQIGAGTAKRLIWRWALLLWLPLLLSGCLRYDLTLRFDHHTHGQIVQTIDLGDRAAALAQP